MSYLILAIVVGLTLFMSIGTAALVWDTVVQWREETKIEKRRKEFLKNNKI